MNKLEFENVQAEFCNNLLSEGLNLEEATKFADSESQSGKILHIHMEEINRLIDLANEIKEELG